MTRHSKIPKGIRTALAALAIALAGCRGTISSAAMGDLGDPNRKPDGGAAAAAQTDGGSTLVDAALDAETAQGSDAGITDADVPADSGTTKPAVGTPPLPATAESVWSPLTAVPIVDPMDYGAIGDGVADDLGALNAAVAALPLQGGIVYLPAGKTFRKTNVLLLTRAHVKLWAPNRQAEIFGAIQGQVGRQSIMCRNTEWCGFFGLKLGSDAKARFHALGDHQITIDHSTDIEIAGVEIAGSAATGMFLYGAQRAYIEGNYVHHTWADHIHHTDATQASWCWDNYVFNEAPSLGDDGIACVTYGKTAARCGDMEWWNNVILGSAWGRGYAVIGGTDISIHDNWAIAVAGAGVIVASEPAYDTASSENIRISRNYLYRSSQNIPHPGILVSGMQPEPLSNLTFRDNVSAETKTGQAFREEGAFEQVTNTGMSDAASDLPKHIPTRADVKLRDTSVLRTQDISFVAADRQRGLYRVHVRGAPDGKGFEQRFEYVVTGKPADLQAFVDARVAAGDYLSERRTVKDRGAYALLLTAAPVKVPSSLFGVPFRALRKRALDGSLGWLWNRANTGSY